MKKRIFALMLCLLIVVSMLVGCGETLIDKAQEYLASSSLQEQEPYVTLNMYIPVQSEIDATTVSSMQTQFNRVIEPLYRTRVIFHMVIEDDYRTTLDAQAAIAKENENKELDTTTALNDNYPFENDFQFDIFVALNKSMIDSYVSSGYVANLTTAMTTTYNRTLSDPNKMTSIPTIIYDNATFKSGDETLYYGVPANYLIGSYSYYVVDIKEASYYYFSQDESIPIETRIDDLRSEINRDPALVDDAAKTARANEIIETVSGDYRTRYAYDESKYVAVREVPVLDTSSTSSLYQGMYCISSMCRYQDRALQVISELYNNANLHTILQYGPEGVTYRLVQKEYTSVNADGSTVTKTSNVVELITGAPSYKINPRYTGNIATLYTCEDEALEFKFDPAYPDYLYLQNADARLQ